MSSEKTCWSDGLSLSHFLCPVHIKLFTLVMVAKWWWTVMALPLADNELARSGRAHWESSDNEMRNKSLFPSGYQMACDIQSWSDVQSWCFIYPKVTTNQRDRSDLTIKSLAVSDRERTNKAGQSGDGLENRWNQEQSYRRENAIIYTMSMLGFRKWNKILCQFEVIVLAMTE